MIHPCNNVLPFPGLRRGPNGTVYTHVEYAVLLRSRSECERVLEYIKSNASVFLNLEYIDNENERQRCVDIFSGAAYVMGCHLNKISPRGMYLISASSILVELDPALKNYVSGLEPSGYPRQNFEKTRYGVSGQEPAYYRNGYPSGHYVVNEPENASTHMDRSVDARNAQPAQSYPYTGQKRQSDAYGGAAEYGAQAHRAMSSYRVDTNHMGRYGHPQNQQQ